MQTILLSDLVGCDSPLQIVKPFGSPLLSAEGCHTRPRKFEFKQNGRKTAIKLSITISAEGCHTRLDGRFFSRVEKPSDDINSRLFLMNKKG